MIEIKNNDILRLRKHITTLNFNNIFINYNFLMKKYK